RLVPPGTSGTCHDRRGPVREKVEDCERPGKHGPGESEGRDLRPPKVADDRRIDEDVDRLGCERAERRQSKPQDLAIVRRAEPHRARTIMVAVKVGIVVPYSWSFWGGVVEHAELQGGAVRAVGCEVKTIMGNDPPGQFTRVLHPRHG